MTNDVERVVDLQGIIRRARAQLRIAHTDSERIVREILSEADAVEQSNVLRPSAEEAAHLTAACVRLDFDWRAQEAKDGPGGHSAFTTVYRDHARIGYAVGHGRTELEAVLAAHERARSHTVDLQEVF